MKRNPNFNTTKYGKYFDKKGRIIKELEKEYFELISKERKDIRK